MFREPPLDHELHRRVLLGQLREGFKFSQLFGDRLELWSDEFEIGLRGVSAIGAGLVPLDDVVPIQMRGMILQETSKAYGNTAIVALVDELVFLYEEVSTGLGLASLAVTTNGAPTIVQVAFLPLEQLKVRRKHANKLVVDEKSQPMIPSVKRTTLCLQYTTRTPIVKRSC